MEIHIVSRQLLCDVEEILGIYSESEDAARHVQALGEPRRNEAFYITPWVVSKSFNGINAWGYDIEMEA